MQEDSPFNPEIILNRLSAQRLSSYLKDRDSNLERALALYVWNGQIASAFLEDIGRLEVVLRNRFDEALTDLVAPTNNNVFWFDVPSLFPGRHGGRTLEDIARAKSRARERGRDASDKNEIISELSFGFWRYLCAERCHTSLWVPALASLFPNHATPKTAALIRSDVEFRMAQLHFLRNRVAHHEPIHRRALTEDAASILELAGWMCGDTHNWMVGLSRIRSVLALKPS